MSSAPGSAQPGATDIEIRMILQRGRFRLELDEKEQARCLGVFGPTGAGKSTLLDAIAGFQRPASGRIVIGGRVLFDGEARINSTPAERKIGMVFQDNRLFPHLTVRENLAFGRPPGPRGLNESTDEAANELLGELELRELFDRRPHELSGGEQKRVALGRALLREGQVLLLDEPCAALDRRTRERVLNFLNRELSRRAGTTVMISHDQEELRILADRLLVIEEGQAVYRGSVSGYF